MPAKVLITGAGGFIGARLWRALAAAGHEVVGCTTSAATPPAVSGGKRHAIRLPNSTFARIVASERPDWVLHCAGTSSVGASFRDPGRDFRDNVAVTECVVRSLAETRPDTRMALFSSAAVYGETSSVPADEGSPIRPISPYGFHKLTAETLCREYRACFGVPTCILRVSSVYGPGLRRRILWDVYQKSRARGPIVLDGTGREVRDLIHVDDLAGGVQAMMAGTGWTDSPINVASGHPITIERVARLMLDALGSTSEVRFSNEPRRGDPTQSRVDVSALRALGVACHTTTDAGIGGYVRWLRAEAENGA